MTYVPTNRVDLKQSQTLSAAEGCRKRCITRVGFTGCGKTRSGERDLFVLKGHDFSRADKANKINGLQPLRDALRDLLLEFKPFSAACLDGMRRRSEEH